MRYASGGQMGGLARFVLSEGGRYQDLELAGYDLEPRRSPDAHPEGLTGWAFLMRSADRSFALGYFERGCAPAMVRGLRAGQSYRLRWFDPRRGDWVDRAREVVATDDSRLLLSFPSGRTPSQEDWAVSLVLVGP
jgi:hypothetical protein